MATLDHSLYPSLTDMASRMAPDGSIDAIAEVLMQMNGIISDMTYREGNLPTGNRHTVRTSLPTPSTRQFYKPTKPGKSTTAQVTENAAMLTAYAEIDAKEAELSGNVQQFRATEDMAFVQGFENEVERLLFHGNESMNPDEFNGLAVRYNSMSGTTTGKQVFSCGGTGNNQRSIWMVGWSPTNGVCGILPRGSKAGLEMIDHGRELKEVWDSNGNSEGRYPIYLTEFNWDLGMMIKDWRSCARIANIDVTEIRKDFREKARGTANGPWDILNQQIIRAMAATSRVPGTRRVMYCDQDTYTAIEIASIGSSYSSTITPMQWQGQEVPSWRGIPIKICDALNANENQVS